MESVVLTASSNLTVSFILFYQNHAQKGTYYEHTRLQNHEESYFSCSFEIEELHVLWKLTVTFQNHLTCKKQQQHYLLN